MIINSGKKFFGNDIYIDTELPSNTVRLICGKKSLLLNVETKEIKEEMKL